MKRIFILSLATAFGSLIAFSIAVQAQPRQARSRIQSASNRVRYSPEPRMETAPLENLVQVDLVPVFDKGVGITFERALSERLLVGPYFSYSYLQGLENSSTFELATYITVLGVSTRYFLTDRFDLGSWYLQAGLGGMRAATDGVGKFNGIPLATGRSELTTFQYQATLGYQFAGWSVGDGAKLTSNIGVGASNSAMLTSSTALYSNGSSGSMTIDTAPKVGAVILAAIGLLF